MWLELSYVISLQVITISPMGHAIYSVLSVINDNDPKEKLMIYEGFTTNQENKVYTEQNVIPYLYKLLCYWYNINCLWTVVAVTLDYVIHRSNELTSNTVQLLNTRLTKYRSRNFSSAYVINACQSMSTVQLIH